MKIKIRYYLWYKKQIYNSEDIVNVHHNPITSEEN